MACALAHPCSHNPSCGGKEGLAKRAARGLVAQSTDDASCGPRRPGASRPRPPVSFGGRSEFLCNALPVCSACLVVPAVIKHRKRCFEAGKRITVASSRMVIASVAHLLGVFRAPEPGRIYQHPPQPRARQSTPPALRQEQSRGRSNGPLGPRAVAARCKIRGQQPSQLLLQPAAEKKSSAVTATSFTCAPHRGLGVCPSVQLSHWPSAGPLGFKAVGSNPFSSLVPVGPVVAAIRSRMCSEMPRAISRSPMIIRLAPSFLR